MGDVDAGGVALGSLRVLNAGCDEAEGLVEEWTLSVPFCQYCKENETEEALIITSQRYLKEEEEESSIEMLRNAARSWKY